jgi:pimeloyl-ACP methyl ester carboxylesterase
MLAFSAEMGTLLGPQFDLIGFDPRGAYDFSNLDVYLTDFTGVSRTQPKVSWFESNAEAALFHWNDVESAARSTYEDLAEFWPRGEIMGRVAEQRNYEAIAHVRTENVATDMLKITEALGYPKLQYYGFSYGTLLGTT